MTANGLRCLLTGYLVCLSAPLMAATLTITTPLDVSLPDQCSLRDALQAVIRQEPVQACEAGTGNDVIELAAGVTHVVDETLRLEPHVRRTPRVDEQGRPVLDDSGAPVLEETVLYPVLQLVTARDGEEGPPTPARLQGPASASLFVLATGARLVLRDLVLQGPAGPITQVQQGGLLRVAGELQLEAGTVLTGGRARQGGAVFLEEGGRLQATEALFQDNHAAEQGGAVARDGTGPAEVTLKRVQFLDNHSGGAGGALFLRGDDLTVAAGNSWWSGNRAGAGGSALHLETVTLRSRVALNNVSLFHNQGGDAALMIEGDWSASAGSVVANSVLVANQPQDCAVPTATLKARYTVSGASCPQPEPVDTAVVNLRGGENLSTRADGRILRNAEGACPAVGACALASWSASGHRPDWQGLLPEHGLGPSGPLPTLLDAGAPEGSSVPCEADDLRGVTRQGRCDVGALEHRRAQGQADEFQLVIGRDTLLDVVANDLLDGAVDCRRVPVQEDCLWLLRDSTRAGVEVLPQVDAEGYPQLLYRFGSSRFDGHDTFSYAVHREALLGGHWPEPSEAGARAGLSAQVNITARPAAGLEDSRTIRDGGGGSIGPLALLGLLLMAGRRGLTRGGAGRWLGGLALCGLSGVSAAAVIAVNSEVDDPGGAAVAERCTLREALRSAQDGTAAVAGCARGGRGEDTVQLPAGIFRLAAPLQVGADNPVVIEGQGPDRTVIDANGLQAFQTHSRLVLRQLTLRNGRHPEGAGGAIHARADLRLESVVLEQHQAREGGAIFLDLSPGQDHARVEIYNSHVRHNRAQQDGGVLAMAATPHERQLLFINSVFEDNRAGGRGGVARVRGLQDRGDVRVVNSVFLHNGAQEGGSVLDLTEAPLALLVASSSWLDNDGGTGPLELGNLAAERHPDGILSHSILAGTAVSCGSGTRQLTHVDYNLFSAPSVTCSGAERDEHNDEASLISIRQALNQGRLRDDSEPLSPSQEEEGVSRWRLPVLPISAPEAAPIVDAGNPDADRQVTAADAFMEGCRDRDMRGVSRASGLACDRGAWELRQNQAVADGGEEGRDTLSNRNRRSRSMLVDVLRNDVAGDGFALRSGTLSLLPLVGHAEWPDTLGQAFVRRRYPAGTEQVVARYDDMTVKGPDGQQWVFRWQDIEDPALACGSGVNLDGSVNRGPGAEDDDCIVVYRLDAELNRPSRASCEQVGGEGLTDRFRYQVTAQRYQWDEDGQRRWLPETRVLEGVVTVQVLNVGPLFDEVPVVRTLRPAGEITLDLAGLGLRDPDGAVVSLGPTPGKLPRYAVKDPHSGQVEGHGLLFDAAGLGFTYRHASTFNRFPDSFSVRATDDCGDTLDIPVMLRFPDEGSGELLKKPSGGGGSAGGWLLLCAGWLWGWRICRKGRL